MKRILFAGQSWARVVAQAVATDPSMRVDHVVVEDQRSLLSFLRALPGAGRLVRVGFRPGARTKEGVLIDILTALFMLRRGRHAVTVYWIGTDVQRAVQDHGRGRHTPFFAILRNARHLTGHETLQATLATIGLRSAVAHVPFRFPAPLTAAEETAAPTRMTVLTYIPDARPQFYGSAMVLDAALRFPDITFEVMGGVGSWLEPEAVPANLRFLGWLGETRPTYLRATHVARLVEHDSLGATVLEGFAYGRRVLYTRDMAGVIYVPFGDCAALRGALQAERAAFRARGFDLNREGFEIANNLDRFDENRDRIIEVVCCSA